MCSDGPFPLACPPTEGLAAAAFPRRRRERGNQFSVVVPAATREARGRKIAILTLEYVSDRTPTYVSIGLIQPKKAPGCPSQRFP